MFCRRRAEPVKLSISSFRNRTYRPYNRSRTVEEAHQEVIDRVRSCIGATIWSAIAGPQGDYVLSLEAGPRQRRSMRLANPRLSFVQRTYEGAYGFLIECPWRLHGPRGVIVSHLGLLGREDPPFSDRIGEMEDRLIEAVELEPPMFDLTIRLSGGLVLCGLSSEVDVRKQRNNWQFWSPRGPVTIGPAGRIGEKPHPDDDRHGLHAVDEDDR